jgi:hypothetical protein
MIIDEDIRRKKLFLNKNELNESSIYLEINYNNSNNSNINIEKERGINIADFSCDYILKNIFSFIKYNDIIKLVKYNKKLQSKLDIDINNYICEYKKLTKSYDLPPHVDNGWGDGFYALHYSLILLPHIIYFIIYYLIINIPEIKLNEIFKDSHWNFINNKIINRLYIILIIVSIYVILHAAIRVFSDYKKRRIIYTFLIILCFGVLCAYEILTIIRIFQIIFYAINRKWLIIFDIIFFIANASYLFFYYLIFIDYKKGETYNSEETKIYLVSYKNIRIDEYVLPDDFIEIKNKRDYISKIANQLKVDYGESDYKLVDFINDFRIKNKLNELKIDYKLPNFILNDSTAILLSSLIFIKLSNNAYVFRFKEYDFDIYTFMENKNISNILLNKNLNRINIIQQGKIKYILIYGYFESNKDINIEIEVKDKYYHDEIQKLKSN